MRRFRRRATPTLPRLAAVLGLLAAAGAACTNESDSGQAAAHEWQLVYQNSLDGRPITGSVDELIGALKRGSPIRVSWGGMDGEEGSDDSWIEFAEPDFTTVIDDSAVVVQFPPSFIQTSYTDVGETYLQTDPPSVWRALMSTDGTYHQFHYDLRTGEITREMYARTEMSWFALAAPPGGPPNGEPPDLTPRDAFRLDSVVTP